LIADLPHPEWEGGQQ